MFKLIRFTLHTKVHVTDDSENLLRCLRIYFVFCFSHFVHTHEKKVSFDFYCCCCIKQIVWCVAFQNTKMRAGEHRLLKYVYVAREYNLPNAI